MEETIDERELARAPMRAHILASINPFAGSSAESASTPEDRTRRHRSRRKRRHSAGRGDGRRDDDLQGSASDNTGDDDKLRPRKTKIRFKSREKRPRHVDDEEDSRSRRRHRSRDYDGELDDGDADERDRQPREQDMGEARPRPSHRRRSSRSRSRSRSPPKDGQRSHRSHKSHRSHRSHRSDRSDKSHKDDHSHKRHRHRSHRRRAETTDDIEPEDPHADPPLDEDAAFRQSLFDAMADDEGAAFWEGVYGQPVHEYAEEASKHRAADAANDPAGLSAMTDDEYAAYVRLRMWERSDEGRRHAARKAAEQRQAREKEEQQQQQKARARQQDKAGKADAAYWAEVDRSLRRGQARRQRKQWQEQWEKYAAAWTAWEQQPTAATIPWPVGAEDVDRDGGDGGNGGDAKREAAAKEARAFFVGDDVATEAGLQTRLRDERVRWHPDKMQQKLGGSVDADVMRRITAIFQVVDRLWGELRRKPR